MAVVFLFEAKTMSSYLSERPNARGDQMVTHETAVEKGTGRDGWWRSRRSSLEQIPAASAHVVPWMWASNLSWSFRLCTIEELCTSKTMRRFSTRLGQLSKLKTNGLHKIDQWILTSECLAPRPNSFEHRHLHLHLSHHEWNHSYYTGKSLMEVFQCNLTARQRQGICKW